MSRHFGSHWRSPISFTCKIHDYIDESRGLYIIAAIADGQCNADACCSRSRTASMSAVLRPLHDVLDREHIFLARSCMLFSIEDTVDKRSPLLAA
jgi:hypothetical protein